MNALGNCMRKVAFPDGKTARRIAAWQRGNIGRNLIAYRCPVDRTHWHLGNNKRR